MDWLKNKFSQLRIKLHSNISQIAKKRVLSNKKSVRSTVAGIEVGNFLIAISTTGMMALGIVPMSLTTIIALAIVFVVLGVVGRYVDAVEDDVERLLKYEEHISKSVVGSSVDSSGIDSVQQQSD
jgi:hypothetical protein